MTETVEDIPQTQDIPKTAGKSQRRRFLVWTIALIILAAFVWDVRRTILTNSAIVPGQITIQTDEGMEISIGEKAYRTHFVTITLADLLGQRGEPPLAIVLGEDVPKPSIENFKFPLKVPTLESREKGLPFPFPASLEQLGGPGAKVVRYDGMGGGGGGSGSVFGKWMILHYHGDVLLRRGDGKLDLIKLEEIEINRRGHYAEHFLIPIRLRPADPQSRDYMIRNRAANPRQAAVRSRFPRFLQRPEVFDRVLSLTGARKFSWTHSDDVKEEVLRDGLYRPGE